MAVANWESPAQVGARLDDETREQLGVIARATERSVASLVRIALREYIARYQGANQN
jgi:predicted transcriptional regulator